MFSVQQLIKATRRLQANASSSADLSKNLKCVTVAGSNHNQSQQQPSVEVSSGSLWSAHDLTTLSSVSASTSSPASSSSTSSSPSLSSPQQQPQHQQQLLHATSENHILYNSKTSQESDDNNINISKISLCSHLNESGSQSLLPTHDSTAQNRKLNSATATTPTPKTPQHSCSRSQQIQNFYQQQLHQFHTQHNQSLWAKQKQTHFTMSSLAAAAEPLSPLKPADCSGAIASNGDQSAKLDGDDVAEGSAPAAAAKSGKTCFKSGLGEILRFMELIGNLKHTKRTGWVLRDVNDCESISGHMYRMSMMTFLLDGTEGLNAIRCMELALVHDLAESIVGDLTPFCGISKEEKRAMEFKAMDDICKLIEPRGKRIMKLFEEYETGVSEESKFVKDLDRLDMVMQAFEYEKRDNCLLKHQEFFNSTEGKFKHPFIKQLVKEIYEQRSSLAKERGATPPPHVIEVPDWENSSTAATNGHCRTKDSAEEQQANEASSSSSTS